MRIETWQFGKLINTEIVPDIIPDPNSVEERLKALETKVKALEVKP